MEESRSSIERRKNEHIDIVLNEDVRGVNVTTGLERYRFKHNALPELDFTAISLETAFLGRRLLNPLLVSSMTGGTMRAFQINKVLAQTAESRGWGMSVGSVRAALERPEQAYSFELRKFAPSIPIIANLGAVQLNYGCGPEECKRAADIVGADGLVLHLNSMQEIMQAEGDTNFSQLLRKIEQVCRALGIPVGVKEVGWGIDGSAARRLADAGINFIDTAGAGGTSWSQVEKRRGDKPLLQRAAEAFADWGIPTADCILDIRAQLPEIPLIASGGMRTGIDAAKAVALGADMVGFGRALLQSATNSVEQLDLLFQRIEFELRAAMFGIGAGRLSELKGTPRLVNSQG